MVPTIVRGTSTYTSNNALFWSLDTRSKTSRPVLSFSHHTRDLLQLG